MDRGWVKLWRKSVDSGLMQNPELWMFWCWCLMKSSRKPHKQMVGFLVVELLPGQFIFGRRQAARELPLTERTIRTCLKKLEMLQNLTIKTTHKYSVISIVNWQSYQDSPIKIDPQSDPQVTHRRPSSDHKQEVKKERSKEKNKNNGAAFVLPAWVDPQLWEAFREVRQKARAAMTDHAESLMVEDLRKLRESGNDPSEVLKQSIKNGWKGVFALKQQPGKAKQSSWEDAY